ncbi:MAG: hypothetical protein M4579_005559 [Chaenotheca gracillima]|nr:MAG: hypothetical protein M4579_005559 [Chaenotheca gracillima]
MYFAALLLLLPLASAGAVPHAGIHLKHRNNLPPLPSLPLAHVRAREFDQSPAASPLAVREPPTKAIVKRNLQTDAPAGTRWQAYPYYQWDDAHKDFVVNAWNGAMAMAKAAADALDNIAPGSPSYQLFVENSPLCKGTKKSTAEFNNCIRRFIANSNVAYGQLFGADPENLELRNFHKIIDNVENLQADQRDGEELLLTVAAEVTDKDSGVNQCDGGTQAFVIHVTQIKQFIDVGGVQPPQNAWVLNFCPPFFQMDRMEVKLSELVADANGKKGDVCNLDNLDTTSRVMLHEWTHLPWTLNTNANGKPKDIRGYMEVTSYGTDGAGQGANQRMHTKSFSSQNADSYAWMGVYQYFNSLNYCQGIKYTGQYALDCTDVWPSSKDKWVKNDWNNYPTGNN